MLKNLGKPSLSLRLGDWLFVCMRNGSLDDVLRTRIRPTILGGYAFWWDRCDAA
jgi:hypothetical protein